MNRSHLPADSYLASIDHVCITSQPFHTSLMLRTHASQAQRVRLAPTKRRTIRVAMRNKS